MLVSYAWSARLQGGLLLPFMVQLKEHTALQSPCNKDPEPASSDSYHADSLTQQPEASADPSQVDDQHILRNGRRRSSVRAAASKSPNAFPTSLAGVTRLAAITITGNVSHVSLA